MKLLVLQLSDIHFQNHRKFVASRTDQIVAAVVSQHPDCQNLLIVLSGDIAYSGTASEYAISLKFIEDLIKSFRERNPDILIKCVGVPGNHDCDYTAPENSTREILLTVFQTDPTKLLPSSAPLESVLAVQRHWREFAQKALEYSPPDLNSAVLNSRDLQFGEKHIRIHLINTALGCERRTNKRDSDQGKLFIPPAFFATSQMSTFDIYSISVLHHPLNWLESNNASTVQTWISSSSDLVLTGHEHDEEADVRDWITKEKNLWVRAAALQDDTGSTSGFNLICVDLESLVEEVTQFTWQVSLYVPSNRRTFSKTEEQRSNRRSVPLLDSMREVIEDPGTGYTHPSKKKLKLNDIYVEPKLQELLGGTRNPRVDDAEETNTQLPDTKLMIVIGEARSGKTTFAKRMFSVAYDSPKNITPLLLDGGDIDASHLTLGKMTRLLERYFVRQYNSRSWEHFHQLPPSQKILLVDNWHSVKLNDQGKAEFLGSCALQFEKIVLFSDETTKIEESGTYTDSFAENGEFSAYKIRPFGHLLRSQLIRKWITFGQSLTLGPKQLHVQINSLERILDTVLGRSLLPSYPFFVLALLQTHHDTKVSNHANGSYGYLYESLITAALAEVSSQSTDFDFYYSVLGRIAWELFLNGPEGITAYQMNRLIVDYGVECKAIIEPTTLTNMLLRANLLMFNEGLYCFRYRYIYYFFTARFLADRAKTPGLAEESKSVMLSLVDTITKEESANVIIFLIYLTRDPDLLNKLIQKAKGLFRDGDLFDAEHAVEFLSPKVKQFISDKRIVVKNTPEENRDTERKDLDTLSVEDDSNPYEGPNSEYAQAIKLMDILGQAVRNFPVSMPGNTKVEITTEVYRIGLRIMSVAIRGMEEGLPQLREFLAKVVRGSQDSSSRPVEEEHLTRKVDSLIVVFGGVICLGLTKTIASAVGLAQLKPVYEEVKHQLGTTPAVELIDISIALSHGVEFPKSQLLSLCDELEDKWFARMILQQLIAYHFAMFHVDPAVAKSIGSKIGIDMRDPKVIARMAAKPK